VIYEATVDNIQMLMRSCIVLERAQLYRFFASHHSQERLSFFLDFLIKERVLDADEVKKNRIWLHRQARPISRPTEAQIAARIKAFWVIASFGCDRILDVAPLEYPAQFMFVTSSNEVYDLTVCDTKQVAVVAAHKRALYALHDKTYEDDVNHIAIVNDRETGLAIGDYGFDSFCILDANKSPRYEQW
jgi:hypothetical protein